MFQTCLMLWDLQVWFCTYKVFMNKINYVTALPLFTCGYAEYWLLVEGVRRWTPVITHADPLYRLQCYVLVLILGLPVCMLFSKNKIKFGQKFFASPKLCTPVHLWIYTTNNFAVVTNLSTHHGFSPNCTLYHKQDVPISSCSQSNTCNRHTGRHQMAMDSCDRTWWLLCWLRPRPSLKPSRCACKKFFSASLRKL